MKRCETCRWRDTFPEDKWPAFRECRRVHDLVDPDTTVAFVEVISGSADVRILVLPSFGCVLHEEREG